MDQFLRIIKVKKNYKLKIDFFTLQVLMVWFGKKFTTDN